jgi:transposase
MVQFDQQRYVFAGASGTLTVPENDQVSRKLAMLIEGECEGLGPTQAAEKFGYSKQRYFQLRKSFCESGIAALQNRITGPKSNYRRTSEVVRQVIRHRFLDPDADPKVIAQKLRQAGWTISTRSVQRIIADYGLQKKTPSTSSSG